MNEIKLSLDNRKLLKKPTSILTAKISQSIGKLPKILHRNEIKDFALDVSCNGCTFSPATFKNGRRCKANFEQQQLFVLDFDNKDPNECISFKEVYDRAEQYELPILFAYETLSSIDQNKFRVIFLNDVSITDGKVAEAIQLALGTIFSEADSSCYKDISKMYYGGKSILYFDNEIRTINIESTFRNLSLYLKDRYKANHYKAKLAKFSAETGIALNKNGLLDITVSDNPKEANGADSNAANGKNSPSTIIYKTDFSNIIVNGEIFPKRYYRINLNVCGEGTNETSVGKISLINPLKNHAQYRSATIKEIEQRCRLYNEFITGKEILNHEELFGISTNLIQVETGIQNFKNVLSKYSPYHEKQYKWEHDIIYMKQQEYCPQGCDNFCPYKGECNHGTNILSTVCLKRGVIEKIPKYKPVFYSIEEVQNDTYSAICKAYKATDKQFQIIKSMTGAGKSYSYLKLMSENPNDRFLISAPTNLLKNEIYNKAKEMGINVEKTPSLFEIKSEIPDKEQAVIEYLYKSGRNQEVHNYIQSILDKNDIPTLRNYWESREKLKTFKGSVITTHRYLLNMDEKRLKEYNAIIIDEDIIFKSIISNQGEITVSELETVLKETKDYRLSEKINQLLKAAEIQTCIQLEGFKYEYGDDNISSVFDIPSFCLTKQFYLRRTSKEKKLKEDTVVYLKPAFFTNVKYIMVSATVEIEICNNFLGKENVSFYECKQAKYKGTLLQYPEKSMSRTCISNNFGIIPKLIKKFDISEDNVITFMRENIGQLHFGNTEGSNTLEGKDILVVGTPYHIMFLYKLAAFTIGLDFDENEEMSSQIVAHNGYRFRFTTFENKNLRAIHFWMLESELEQAVGRARLLRNECIVHLFSNFPLGQAEMVTNFLR